MMNPFEKTRKLGRETRNKASAIGQVFVSRFVFGACQAWVRSAVLGLMLALGVSDGLGQTTIPNTPPPPETGPATRPAPDPVRPPGATSTLAEAFRDVSLEQAVANLRSLSGANIVVHWKALEAAGVERQARVSISLTSAVKFRKLLNLVLESASPAVPLVFEAQDNVITITTQVEADKRMVTRMYPVDDLLITPIPVAPANFELSAGGSGGGAIGNFQTDRQTRSADEEKTQRAASGEEFIRLVTTNIRPEIWKQNGGTASITMFQGKLIVTAPLSVHERLLP